jgi:prolipoprotein diacylglyceryltransferase
MLPELHLAVPGGWHCTIGTHALVTVLAVLAATWLVARRAPAPALAWTAPVSALVVLAGARVFFWALGGGPLRGPSGLASMGGVLAAVVVARPLAWLARVPLSVLLDALVPAGLLALGIGRLGCFLAGCCYGTETALPWGVVFSDLGQAPRHPLQLYAAALDLAIVYAVGCPAAPAGVTAARTVSAFATARFALESLRDRGASDYLETIGLTLAQVCCLVLFGGARVFLRPSSGGLSRLDARASVARHMRTTASLAIVLALGMSGRALGTDADFDGRLVVRPARGTLDIATGEGALQIRRWRLVPAAESDGIDPATEPITVSLGTDEVTLPAGALTPSADGRRYVFGDDTVTRGLARLRLKRRSNGAWLVSVDVVGLDLTRLVTQFPRCEPLAFAVGNDEGVSGVDIDRPRGANSPRMKIRGFCELDECPQAIDLSGQTIRPRHAVCPD